MQRLVEVMGCSMLALLVFVGCDRKNDEAPPADEVTTPDRFVEHETPDEHGEPPAESGGSELPDDHLQPEESEKPRVEEDDAVTRRPAEATASH